MFITTFYIKKHEKRGKYSTKVLLLELNNIGILYAQFLWTFSVIIMAELEI